MALPDYTPRNIVYYDLCNPVDAALPPQIHEWAAALDAFVLPAQIFEELARHCNEHERKDLLHAQHRMMQEGRISDSVEVAGLARVLPDVMPTVRQVRRRLDKHRRLGDRLDLTFAVLLFVETCLSVVNPSAFVLENAQFALSRPPYSSSDPLANFIPHYSRASFAFLPLDVSKDNDMKAPSSDLCLEEVPPTQNSGAPSSSSTHYPFDYGETLEKWLEIHARQSRSSHVKHGSSRSYVFPEDDTPDGDLEGPEHAPEIELLARHFTGKLCILVAASRNRLPQAVSSALFHRRACGVLDPVVGLVVNPDSATVEFAIGWLATSVFGNELPTVNIAWHMADSRCSRGAFELTDIGSTLLFGGIILSLMTEGGPGRGAAGVGVYPPVDEYLSWRMDNVAPFDEPGPCDAHDNRADLIANWAQTTGRTTQIDADDESVTSGKGTGSKKTSSNPSHPVIEQVDDAAQSQNFGRWPKTAASSIYSVLAGQTGSATKAEPFWTWLHDRHVFTVMFPPPWLSSITDHTSDVFRDQFTTISPFVDRYNAYIAFPPSCLNSVLLQVPNHPDPLVSHFHETLAKFQASLAEHPSNCREAWMDGLSNLLYNHCHDILRIVVLARRAKRMVDEVDALEFRFGKYFDLLLEIGLDNLEPGPGGAAVATLYEKQLQMPCNKLFHQASTIEHVLRADVSTASRAAEALFHPTNYQTNLLREEVDAYDAATQTSDVPREEADRMLSFASSVHGWHLTQRHLDSNVHNPIRLNFDMLSSRSAKAPRTGKCDAIGVLRIPGVFSTLTQDAKAFQILRPPIPTTTRCEHNLPVDGVSVLGTQRLDKAWEAGSGQPVDPTVTHDVYTSARSGRAHNVIGHVQGPEAALRKNELSQKCQLDARETSGQVSSAGEGKPSSGAGIISDCTHPTNGVSSPSSTNDAESDDDFANPRGKDTEDSDLKSNMADLYVPLIVVEHKKTLNKSDRTGENRLRGYQTAASTYLEHLGILKFPLFGMLTEGTVGIVTCSWSDTYIYPGGSQGASTRHVTRLPESSTVTYIMDRNACSFDISDPRDALNLVAFLYKISRIHAPELQKVLKATCDKIRNGEITDFPQWNQSQMYPK